MNDPIDRPIRDELDVPLDDAAVDRVWRRLDARPEPRATRPLMWAAAAAIAGLAVVAWMGVERPPDHPAIGADPSAPPTVISPAPVPPAPPAPPTAPTPAPPTPEPMPVPPPPAPAPPPTRTVVSPPPPIVAPEPAPARPAPPTPPVDSVEDALDRAARGDRGGARAVLMPLATDEDALRRVTRRLMVPDPALAAEVIEAQLARSPASTAELHVLLSDAWFAAGDQTRAARAARRALRFEPGGPDAARMRQRAVPRSIPP